MLRRVYWLLCAAIENVDRLRRAITTEALRCIGRNDDSRWSKLDKLSTDWDERTALLATWVPAGARVLEFGSGRQAIRRYLPEGCVYTPTDVVDRGSGVLRYDLNKRPLDPIASYDVAIFSGVLEYVQDIEGVLRHIAPSFDCIAASYAPTDIKENRAAYWRRSRGWISDYSSQRLVDAFTRAGYVLVEKKEWHTQYLYRFQKHVEPGAL